MSSRPRKKHKHATNKSPSLKPLLEESDEVYAAFWPDLQRNEQPSWYPGVVTSYTTDDNDDGYGSTRFYNVSFDDGDTLDDIEDLFVFHREEYELISANMKRGHNNTWIGVKNVLDKKSQCRWANTVGWYVATIDEKDHSFSRLADALRAYDSSVVRDRGRKVKKAELNLPDEWEWLFYNSGAKTAKEGIKKAVEQAKQQHQRHLQFELKKLRREMERDHARDKSIEMEILRNELGKQREDAVRDAISESDNRWTEKMDNLRRELEKKHDAEKSQLVADAIRKANHIAQSAMIKLREGINLQNKIDMTKAMDRVRKKMNQQHDVDTQRRVHEAVRAILDNAETATTVESERDTSAMPQDGIPSVQNEQQPYQESQQQEEEVQQQQHRQLFSPIEPSSPSGVSNQMPPPSVQMPARVIHQPEGQAQCYEQQRFNDHKLTEYPISRHCHLLERR